MRRGKIEIDVDCVVMDSMRNRNSTAVEHRSIRLFTSVHRSQHVYIQFNIFQRYLTILWHRAPSHGCRIFRSAHVNVWVHPSVIQNLPIHFRVCTFASNSRFYLSWFCLHVYNLFAFIASNNNTRKPREKKSVQSCRVSCERFHLLVLHVFFSLSCGWMPIKEGELIYIYIISVHFVSISSVGFGLLWAEKAAIFRSNSVWI